MDSSSYGWRAVLNNNIAYRARGFWYEDDRAHRIMWKNLRAVRHAVESFMPQLRGRRVLLHEDNTAVVAATTNFTSRSPVMMEELRKLWHRPVIHDISIRPRFIRPRPTFGRTDLAGSWATPIGSSVRGYSRTCNACRSLAVQLFLQYSVPGRLSRARRAPCRLAVRPDSGAPCTASMAAELRGLLGTGGIGQAALGLLTGSLAAGTYRNYDSGMIALFRYVLRAGGLAPPACYSQHDRPLHCMQGTVGAESLHQYYSSINKYFRDHQRQHVALVKNGGAHYRGMAIQHERLAEEDARVAVPAPIAADTLETAMKLLRTLVWEPGNIADIRAFIAALATITSYVFVCRAKSGVSCETGDLMVDRPSGSILLYVCKQKGDPRTRVSAKLMLDLPIADVPDLVDLMDWYTTVATSATCRRFYGASPPPKF
eukprot:jgi/Tetstr1/462621/TSEL_007606.t1